MSLMYASVTDLGNYLHNPDINAASATLALQTASQLFSTRANTMFEVTAVTYQAPGLGYRQLFLPYRPVVAVSAVRVAGVLMAASNYSLIRNVLYSLTGFGSPGRFPPDLLEVDLTYGYAAVPDDVKGAVLETAGAAYQGPDVTVQSEQIDDYQIRMATNMGGVMLTPSALALANLYRGTMAA